MSFEFFNTYLVLILRYNSGKATWGLFPIYFVKIRKFSLHAPLLQRFKASK